MKDQSSSKDHLRFAPALFAWLASATLVLLIVATQFLPRGDHQFLRIAGVVNLLIAAVFIFEPFYILSKHGKRSLGKTYMQAEEVVDSGLYAITRHPQYLGYMLLGCGFALLSTHWAAFLLAIIVASLFRIQAVKEERYCLSRFGEPYAQYLRRVPRFNILLGIRRLLQER